MNFLLRMWLENVILIDFWLLNGQTNQFLTFTLVQKLSENIKVTFSYAFGFLTHFFFNKQLPINNQHLQKSSKQLT